MIPVVGQSMFAVVLKSESAGFREFGAVLVDNLFEGYAVDHWAGNEAYVCRVLVRWSF